jgi:hypothetical protein
MGHKRQGTEERQRERECGALTILDDESKVFGKHNADRRQDQQPTVGRSPYANRTDFLKHDAREL